MSQLDFKLGPKIKAFRRQIGLQANKLANQLNISPSYLALIEGGKRKIDGDLLIKICDELKINISVINPGFIDTESTKLNSFKMPLLKPPSYAADKIFKGLTGKYKFEIYFPFVVVFSIKIMRFLPLKIYSFIWRKLGNF